MKLFLALLALLVIAQQATAQSGYGSYASSSQSRSGHQVAVLNSASSDSQSDDSQDDSDVAAPIQTSSVNSYSSMSGSRPVKLPILPPLRGWIKKPTANAGTDYSQDSSDSDSSDDNQSNGGYSASASQQTSSRHQSGSRQQSGSRSQAVVSSSDDSGQQGSTGGNAGPIITGVVYPPIVEGGQPPPQVPGVWEALNVLRGKKALGVEEIQDLLQTAQPGVDFPNLVDIPDKVSFSCANVKQAGYYADIDSGCQAFRRCDLDGVETSYLCPYQTLYNQITLVCDWFYNVQCANSLQFYDYSNARLYHSDWVLLDTPPETDADVDAGQVSAVKAANAANAAANAAKRGNRKSHSNKHRSGTSSRSGKQRSSGQSNQQVAY